jgi:hypothetical protein
MKNKQGFTQEEWTKILESTMLAGIAISAADPSGLWGTLKEAFASREALAASKFVVSSELVREVVADLQTSEGRSIVQETVNRQVTGAHATEIVHRSIELLHEVSQIVDKKAPNEAAAFKTFLMGISQKVAEASYEGGFLGFGGVKVSDAEKATLEDISKALGLT